MKPGEVLSEGPFGCHACAILNDLEKFIGLPSIVLEQVKENSGSTPTWPLGVYVLFTEEGITLGIHGKTLDGEITDKYSSIELEEDTVPDLGEEVWKMWKLLRNSSDEQIEVNYQLLLKKTLESSN